MVTTARISWSLPPTYNAAASSVLVFVKADSAVNLQTPTLDPSRYQANGNIGLGTPYQHDAAASCVAKTDAQTTLVLKLQPSKNYHILILVVNDADSTYSQSAVFSFTQQVPNPLPLVQLNSVPLTATSAQITWQKPAGYNNSKYTTVLYLKADTLITNAQPLAGITSINASTIFKNGSKFQFDTLAHCIFKGDTNLVTVTNLSNAKKYFLSAWVVEDFDSVYSTEAKIQVESKPPPPLYSIGSINKVNSITGVTDSLGKGATIRGIVYGFNQTLSGLSFLLADATGGIQISSPGKTFGYPVAEGDSLQISGIVGTQRGLAILQTLDTIVKLGSARPLQNPVVVNTLNESTENKLIQVKWVRFVTPPAGSKWPTVNSNIKVIKVGTTDTLTIRLLSASALAGQNLPKTTIFTVTGLGSQISTSFSAPFQFDGYQIIPRNVADIQPNDTLEEFTLLQPVNSSEINIDTLPANQLNFRWQRSANLPIAAVPTYTLELDTAASSGLFASPDYTNNSASDTSITLIGANLRNKARTKLQWQMACSCSNWQLSASINRYVYLTA
jgi:hypothetical protein